MRSSSSSSLSSSFSPSACSVRLVSFVDGEEQTALSHTCSNRSLVVHEVNMARCVLSVCFLLFLSICCQSPFVACTSISLLHSAFQYLAANTTTAVPTTTVSPSSSSISLDVKIVAAYSCPGNDLGIAAPTSASATDCGSNCLNAATCVASEFLPKTGSCTLKASCPSPIAMVGHQMAFKLLNRTGGRPSPLWASSLGADCVIDTNTSSSNDISVFPVAYPGYFVCQYACEWNSNCVAAVVEWTADNAICRTKSVCNSAFYTGNHTILARNGVPPFATATTSSPTAATSGSPTTSSASSSSNPTTAANDAGGGSSSGVNTSYITTAVSVSVIGGILSGIIATMFWKFRQLNELAKERSKKPLAAFVFRAFSLFEYRDFDSNDGRAFVTMMNHIDFQILRTFRLSRDAASASSPIHSGVEQLDVHRERLIHTTLVKKMRKLGTVVPTKVCCLRMCCCLQAHCIEPDTLTGSGSLAKQQQLVVETVASLKMEAAFSNIDVQFNSVVKANSASLLEDSSTSVPTLMSPDSTKATRDNETGYQKSFRNVMAGGMAASSGNRSRPDSPTAAASASPSSSTPPTEATTPVMNTRRNNTTTSNNTVHSAPQTPMNMNRASSSTLRSAGGARNDSHTTIDINRRSNVNATLQARVTIGEGMNENEGEIEGLIVDEEAHVELTSVTPKHK